MTTAFSATGQWTLALDLLVARSVLDAALRAKLLADPEVCCKANGVSIPDGLRLVVTHPDQPTLIREIPSTLAAGSFKKTGVTPQLREPVVYNGTTEYTEATTTVSGSDEYEGDLSVGTADAEAETETSVEAVVVLT